MLKIILHIKYRLIATAIFCLYIANVLHAQENRSNKTDEAIYLYTDKTSYLAGEVMWFKCHLQKRYPDSNIILSKTAYVELLANNGASALQSKIAVTQGDGAGSFYLPLNLPTGIYTLLSYTSKLKNAGADHFYMKKIAIINSLSNIATSDPGDSNNTQEIAKKTLPAPKINNNNIQISTGKSSYDSREKVAITIQQKTTAMFSGTLSVSYLPASSGMAQDDEGQYSELNNNNKSYQEFIPEYDGHIITAKVINIWDNQPAANISCLLSVPSSVPFGFYTGKSDKNGIVRFNVKRFYGPGNIVIKSTPLSDDAHYNFEIINPFADSAHKKYYKEQLILNKSDSTDLIRRSIAMQAMNSYRQKELNSFFPPAYKDTLPFFGKPEVSYLLDDYKRFSTMEEVLREYVTNINVTLRNSKLYMTMYDEKYGQIYNENILVLLDGVPLSDYNSIFNYDPLKVKKLDVVPRRYLYGNAVYSGIASFETYNSDFDGSEIDPAAKIFDYDGFQLNRNFYQPIYTSSDKGNERIPDYRTTLLWLPDLTVDEKTKHIDCFTSDFKGTYKIVIKGFLTDGTPVSGETTFEVK